ncbi:MAG: hypothetical protein ACLT2Z_08995 [Eubacterium sp.]
MYEIAKKKVTVKGNRKYDEKPINIGFMPLPIAGGTVPLNRR